MANLNPSPGQGGADGVPREPKKKSSRKLAIIMLSGMVVLVVVVAYIANPDMGQNKMMAAVEAHKLAEQRTQYSERIPNPKQSTQQAYQSAIDSISRKKDESAGNAQLTNAITPPPGASEPPAPTISPDGYARKSYGAAAKAVLGSAGQAGAGADRHRVGVASAQGPTQPAFVVYAEHGSKQGVLSSAFQGQGKNAVQSAGPSDQAKLNSDCAGDPQCVQAQQNAAEARSRAQASAAASGAGGPNDAADLNSSWLYRAHNSAVKSFKDLVAQTGKGLYWVAPGTVVTGVLESAIDTSIPGQIIVRVTGNVYDSRYGRYLVIPAGSLLEGTYNATVKDGQHRVAVAMDTLVTPSGGEIPLGAMTLSDGIGRSGVPGQLHTHFWSRMGIAFLMGLEADEMDRLSNVRQVVASPYGGGGGSNTNSQAISSGGQIVVSAANEQLKEMFALGPNITVRPGAVVSLMTSQGIEIPPVANTR